MTELLNYILYVSHMCIYMYVYIFRYIFRYVCMCIAFILYYQGIKFYSLNKHIKIKIYPSISNWIFIRNLIVYYKILNCYLKGTDLKLFWGTGKIIHFPHLPVQDAEGQ